MNHIRNAAQLIASLGEQPLDSADDSFNRGNAYALMGRHEKAMADFDRANELEPDTEGGMAWYNRGNSLVALGRIEEAIESYRRPIELGTPEYGPYQNLATRLTEMGQHEEALAIYDRYLEVCERDKAMLEEFGSAIPACFIGRATSLRHLGRDDDANASIEKALELEPDAFIHQAAGDHYALIVGDFEAALPHYERSYQSEPGWAIRARLGLAYSNVGRRDEALAILREAIAEEPGVCAMLRAPGWSEHLVDQSLLDDLPMP